MAQIQEQIQRLHNKLGQLLKHLAALEKENELQRKELLKLRADNTTQDTLIRSLQEQNYILKAATGKMSDREKAALEQSINRYIREIDKCIGLLSE